MIEVLKQALEALELHAKQYPHMQKGYTVDAITSLRQAIAETEKHVSYTGNGSAGRENTTAPTGFFFQMPKAEQEPVAWQVHPFDYGIGYEGVYARTDRKEQVEMWKRKGWDVQPLYTHPQPKREWVGLTDEEVIECLGAEAVRIPTGWSKLTQAIEAKLKEKNT